MNKNNNSTLILELANSNLKQGEVSLWLLCAANRWKLVRDFIAKGIKLDWNTAPAEGEDKGKSALWLLCVAEQWGLVKDLIAKDSTLDWNMAPAKGELRNMSALWFLCAAEQWELVESLIAKGIKLNWNTAPAEGEDKGQSALWFLCATKQWKLVKELIDKNIPLDWNMAPAEGEDNGISALWWLCAAQQWELVESLIAKGIILDWNIAPADGEDKGKSALWFLCATKQWKLVKELISKNIILDWNAASAEGSARGMSALWWLCAAGQWELVENLIAKNIPLDWNIAPAEEKLKRVSSLWFLCIAEQWDLVKNLVANNITLNWNTAPADGDSKGKSALWFLCAAKQWDLVQQCLIVVEDLNLANNSTLTMLMESPLFEINEEYIKYHLYRSELSEISLGLHILTVKQQEFLKAIIDYHPTLETIHIGPVTLVNEYPVKTFLEVKQGYNRVKAACRELRVLMQQIDEQAIETVDLPKSVKQWKAYLNYLHEADGVIWYVERLRKDYILILLEYLQLRVSMITNNNVANSLANELIYIVNDIGIKQLPWEFQGQVYDIAYHCLLDLKEHCQLPVNLINTMSYQAYYAYTKAEKSFEEVINYVLEPWRKRFYKSLCELYGQKRDDFARICKYQMGELLNLGLTNLDKKLSESELNQLIEVLCHYTSMGSKLAGRSTITIEAPTSVTVSGLVDNSVTDKSDFWLRQHINQQNKLQQLERKNSEQAKEIAELKAKLKDLQAGQREERKKCLPNFFKIRPGF